MQISIRLKTCNDSRKRDESLITSECQRIENPFEIKNKGIQKHVDPPIIYQFANQLKNCVLLPIRMYR